VLDLIHLRPCLVYSSAYVEQLFNFEIVHNFQLYLSKPTRVRREMPGEYDGQRKQFDLLTFSAKTNPVKPFATNLPRGYAREILFRIIGLHKVL
jgi:hypothetical protein